MKRTKNILLLWAGVAMAAALGLGLAWATVTTTDIPNTITLPDGSEWEVLEYSASRRAYRVGEGLWIDQDYITNKTR